MNLWRITANYTCRRTALVTIIIDRLSKTREEEEENEQHYIGVHPLSWLLSNNRLEKVPFVSVPHLSHTSSNRLLLRNQDKGCTPSVAHSLAVPLGPALLNLWYSIIFMFMRSVTFSIWFKGMGSDHRAIIARHGRRGGKIFPINLDESRVAVIQCEIIWRSSSSLHEA